MINFFGFFKSQIFPRNQLLKMKSDFIINLPPALKNGLAQEVSVTCFNKGIAGLLLTDLQSNVKRKSHLISAILLIAFEFLLIRNLV